MVLAMVDDIRVVLVKLADRLHNMRTLEYLNPEKRRRIAQETLDVYAPIAHRLGMGKVRGRTGRSGIQVSRAGRLSELQAAVERRRPELEAFLEEVRERVSQHMAEEGVPMHSIEARIKRLFQRLSEDEAPEDHHSTRFTIWLRVRIITKDVRDCYAALGVIHKHWHPVPGRIKDFIATPRENLYQSLHTSVDRRRRPAI